MALKKAVTESPMLRLPDFSKAFRIECDASSVSLEVSLCKRDNLLPFTARLLKVKLCCYSHMRKRSWLLCQL